MMIGLLVGAFGYAIQSTAFFMPLRAEMKDFIRIRMKLQWKKRFQDPKMGMWFEGFCILERSSQHEPGESSGN